MSRLVEEWRPVVGYENLYEVSDWGNVRSLNYRCSKKIKTLKPFYFSNGYCGIKLHKENKVKNYLIHRLVAETFIPNPNNEPCVNHIDENITNNVKWNLEWCSQKYNCNYGSHNMKLSNSIKNSNTFKTAMSSEKYKEIKRNLAIKRERDTYGRFI